MEKHCANRKCLGFFHMLTSTGYLHITYFWCIRIEIVLNRYAKHFTWCKLVASYFTSALAGKSHLLKGLPDKLLLGDMGEKPGQCMQRIPACIFSTPPEGMRTPPVPWQLALKYQLVVLWEHQAVLERFFLHVCVLLSLLSQANTLLTAGRVVTVQSLRVLVLYQAVLTREINLTACCYIV